MAVLRVGARWYPTPATATSAAVVTTRVDFAAGLIEEGVEGQVELEIDPSRETNAVRLAGRLGLSARRELGPTHALNGDKILAITPLRGVCQATLRWRYRMGAGLGALELECEPVTSGMMRSGLGAA